MVGFGAVGFALSVVVVLEFCSACWAVCDAHGLCSGEYLFSELFVFSCACSAHRVSLFFLFVLVLGGGASQRQRDERLHRPNTTLFSSSPRLSFSFWNGVCCVVRAQLCEHARNTTHALLFLVRLLSGCVLCTTTTVLLLTPHTFVINVPSVQH